MLHQRFRSESRNLSSAGQAPTVSVPTLAALKALTARPEAVIVETGQAKGLWQWELGSSTTADDALVVQCTSGPAGRYKRIYEAGEVWAEWFGAVGDDSTDNATAIAAAIAAVGPFGAGTVQDGGTVRFGAGIFRVGSSIDLTQKHGVILRGLGFATELKGTGDFAVIKFEGATSADATNKVGVRDMIIRGAGKANTSAHGISTKWTNRCFIENVQIFGCRHGLNLYHNWQLELYNVQPHGAGSDQNYIGFYLGPTTLTDIDNAVIATGCTAQQCEHAGFRIVNGQGSKFTSCEAGASAYGWYVGDPASGTVLCQWINFENCLGDSCTTQNWFFRRGSATALGEMIMTGTWTGNSSGAGIQLENATDFTIVGLICITAATEGVKLIDSSRVIVEGASIRQYNNANAGHAAVKLENSSNCTINGVNEFSTNARSPATETGTSDANTLASLSGQPTLVGTASIFTGSLGTYGWQHRRTGDAAVAVIGGTGNTAYYGMGTVADPLIHNVRRTPNSDIEFVTNGGLRFTIGNGSGVGFANRHSQPFGYATGTGGTVTQGSGSGKATGVTLNTSTGLITMDAAALAADTTVSFTLSNSLIVATDTLILNHVSGGTAGSYLLNAQCGATSASINVRNITAGSLSEAIVIRFTLVKSVSA